MQPADVASGWAEREFFTVIKWWYGSWIVKSGDDTEQNTEWNAPQRKKRRFLPPGRCNRREEGNVWEFSASGTKRIDEMQAVVECQKQIVPCCDLGRAAGVMIINGRTWNMINRIKSNVVFPRARQSAFRSFGPWAFYAAVWHKFWSKGALETTLKSFEAVHYTG